MSLRSQVGIVGIWLQGTHCFFGPEQDFLNWAYLDDRSMKEINWTIRIRYLTIHKPHFLVL